MPMRKPNRIPCLTQEFTRHSPPAVLSAARTSPRLSAVFSSANTARSAAANSLPCRAASDSISSRNRMRRFLKQSDFDQDLSQTDATLILNWHQRQTEVFFNQTHHRERCFYRTRTGLNEIDVHQRQQSIVKRPSLIPFAR